MHRLPEDPESALPPATSGAEPPRQKDQFARQGAYAYIFGALTLAVTMLSGILVARVLGTAGRGELAAILVTPQILGWLFALGAQQAISYHQARWPRDARSLVGTWLLLVVPLGGMALLLGQALIPTILSAQSESVQGIARLYMITVVVVPFGQLVYGLLLGDQDFLFYSIMGFLFPAGVAAGYVGLWAADALSVRAAVAVSAFVGIGVVAIATMRAIMRHGVGRPSMSLGVQTSWYAFRAHGSNIGGLLNARLDLVIIPAFLAASSVGLYAVATNVSWLVVSLSGALATLVLPAAARRGVGGGVETVIGALHVTLGVGCALALALALVADAAVPLVYGEAFAGSVSPLLLLLPGCVLYAGAGVVCSGLNAAGRPFTASLAQGAGICATVLGLLMFLKSGGIVAAALVSTVAYALVFAVALALYRQAVDLRWGAFLPRSLDITSAVSAARSRLRGAPQP